MRKITLTPKFKDPWPIDAKYVSPDQFKGKSVDEIGDLPAWYGNKEVNLKDLFEIREQGGEGEEVKIILKGEMPNVNRIGRVMKTGEIEIEGSVGFFLGVKMKGGKITMKGNTNSWVGAEMKGGTIEIHGSAGGNIGSALRGNRTGMKGGLIHVHGNAGDEIGSWMNGGTIIIDGNAGSFAGVHMQGGEIIILGDSGGREGAEMKNGSVTVVGKTSPPLPSFMFERKRKSVKIKATKEKVQGPFYVFTGDLNEDGNGKLNIGSERNPYLSYFDRFL